MLTLQANIACNLTGANDKTLSPGILINNGTVTWNGGNIVASYGSVINNNGIFVIQSSGFFNNNGGNNDGSHALPGFVNNGWLLKTISNGETIIDAYNGGWNFYQNGTFDVENGVLSSQSQFYVTGGAIFAGPGETRVDAGTAVINGTNIIQAGATVELAAGSWSGSNLFTGPGTFVWSGGTLTGTNTIAVGANLAILGAGAKTLTLGKLVNAGNGVWTGAGAVNCSYGSVFENDGAFTVQNDSSFANNGANNDNLHYMPVFVNNGSLVKNTTTGTTAFPEYNGGVNFDNNGVINVESGDLSLGGGGYGNNGSFTTAAGSVIDFNGGAFFLNGNLALSGAGTNRVNGATVTFNYGTNTIGAGSTFEIASGSIAGTNTVAGVGTVNWSGGTIAAMLTLRANIACNLTGANDKTLSPGILINNGTVTWNGGNIVASYGSVINNNGIFVIQSSGFFNNNGGNNDGSHALPGFVNNGWLLKTISNGETIIDAYNGGWNFYQNGTFDVENGVLSSQSQFYVTGGAIFAGPGETRVDAGTAVINGTNIIQAGATVELAAGSWSGSNLFTGPGTFVWSGGTLTGTNTIAVGANLAILGAGAKTLTLGKLVNAGNGVWTGAGAVNCSYGSVFENDGAFTVQNDSSFANNGANNDNLHYMPVFVNNGSLVKNTTTGTTAFPEYNGGVNFDNNGVINVESGDLSLGGGGYGSNGSFTTAAGSVIDFNGGAFFFNGNLALLGGGTNRVSGATVTFNYGTNTIGAGSTFEIASGSVKGTNTVAGVGTVNWSGGTIAAMLTLQANIACNLTGANDRTLSQ